MQFGLSNFRILVGLCILVVIFLLTQLSSSPRVAPSESQDKPDPYILPSYFASLLVTLLSGYAIWYNRHNDIF
jgi:hypothetical protein